MRIAIVDDEEGEIHELKKMLIHFADIQRLNISCDCFLDGTAFLAAVSPGRYDMVFMDIYMEKTDGIETAFKMRRLCPDCCLIFLTSSQEHMAQAFPCHAFDYLIKPLEPAQLTRTLSDFLRIFPENQQYLNLSVGKQIIPVLYSHLEYICTDANYCIVQAQEQYRCRIPFNKLKSTLEKDMRFCTINRGILVNLDYVDTMENLVCWMKNGVSFPMNTKKKTELKQILINYRFNIRRKQFVRR